MKKRKKYFSFSAFKRNIVEKIFQVWYLLYLRKFKYKNQNRVLVVSLDALGDTMVKIGMFRKIEEHFGKEKVFILCKDKWFPILEKLKFQAICFHNEKALFRILKEKVFLTKRLNAMGFETLIFCNHDGNILYGTEVIAEKKFKLHQNIKVSNGYVLEQDIEFLNHCFSSTYSYLDILPSINDIYPLRETEEIVIGIGAANFIKTMSIKKMKEIVRYLLERYPEKRIVFLGSGKKQQEYFKQLCQDFPQERCINKIDAYEITEVISKIASSSFFVGFDSGLSNVAFALKKKYILLYWHEGIVWQHPVPYIQILKGNGETNWDDGKYGSSILNSIRVEDVHDALDRLYL